MKYTLQIDREGFPHFDGVRVTDPVLLRLLLENVRRTVTGDPYSALKTTCEGEDCFVDAFNTPWIAQEVVGDAWHFLGGFKKDVPRNQLRIDPWNRVVTWIGVEQIPAILSRNAQNRWLDSLPEQELQALKKQTLESATTSWAGRYEEAERTQTQLGWDLKGPSPVLMEGMKHLPLKPGAKILVPGAGFGHDAHYLSSLGFDVTAMDLVPKAEETFRKLYPTSLVRFLIGDFFNTPDRNTSFDAVLEHTIFIAIDPPRRKEYVQRVVSLLKPGGKWFGVYLLMSRPGGPPHPLSQWELERYTENDFTPLQWGLSLASAPPRLGKELWACLEKKL